jgi:glutamyl-tRNA reductase
VLYRLTDATAALHLNRVAAGLDSLVPGEAQVLGQVRAALALAMSEGTVGLILSRAFQRALETGKRARSETAISAGNASVASVAASLADGALGGLAGRSALVVGAGRTSELAALNLMSRGLRRLSVANRTFQSACVLAGRLGGSAVHFEDVAGHLRDVDVVVSSTAAPHAVLRTDMVEPAMVGRSTPLVFLDLAVPSDVEPGVAGLAGCSVHTLDDLALQIGRTVALRREEAVAAEAICADAAEEFRAWQAERTVAPAIGRLRATAETLRAAEVERLAVGLDPAERERLERLSRQLVGKLLHHPTTRLRESASGPDGVQYAETALDLFGLADDPA